MSFILYLLLFIFYLVSGYGVLTLFGLRLRTAYMITLSLLLGVAVASFTPFLLQLFYIPLTPGIVFSSLLLVAVALNIPTIRRIRKEGWPAVRRIFALRPFRLLPYEIPYLVIFGFFVLVSVWRCYYLPPTSRDALSGPEAIAEYTVREHTMINSFFNVDLWSTNNQFKSPFLISLQMLYKMAGFPFGQVWLSILFVSFLVFLYHAMKEKIHPVLAGLFMLLFLMAPEVYAYTFMILYDYSNMIFFFLSLYFLFEYFRNKLPPYFYFSGLLMGIATYIRSETLALAFLFLPLILFVQFRGRDRIKKIIPADFFFFLPALLSYYLTSQLWIKYYLPVHYDVSSLVNTHLSDLHPLFQRYGDIVGHLVFSKFGIHLWGYIYFIALLLFLGEGLSRGRYNKEARNWLYAIAVFYLGLGALGFLLPVVDLNDTTKRAMFKLLPLLLLYLANNDLLIRLSRWISRWEGAPAALVLGGERPKAALAGSPVSGKTVGGGKSGRLGPGTASSTAKPATRPAAAPATGKTPSKGTPASGGKTGSSKKRRNK